MFKNLKIGVRLGVGFGLVVALMIALGVIGILRVAELNTKIKTFPNNMFARGLGFHERDFFEVVDGAAIAEPPRVQF